MDFFSPPDIPIDYSKEFADGLSDPGTQYAQSRMGNAISASKKFPIHDEVETYMQSCKEGTLPEVGGDALFCITNVNQNASLLEGWNFKTNPLPDAFQKYFQDTGLSTASWNYTWIDSYGRALDYTSNLCNNSDAWIYFYYPLDTQQGSRMVEEYISSAGVPEACATALRDKQRSKDAIGKHDSQNTWGQLDSGAKNPTMVLNDPMHDVSSGYKVTGLLWNPPDVDMNKPENVKQALFQSYFIFGDPTKTPTQRTAQYRDMLPTYPAGVFGTKFLDYWAQIFLDKTPPPPNNPPPSGETGLTGTVDPQTAWLEWRLQQWYGSTGKYTPGETNPYDDNPTFKGRLPKLPDTIVGSMHAWTENDEHSQTGIFRDKCGHTNLVQEVFPILGLVGGAMIAKLLPLQETDYLVAAISLGGSGFFLLQSITTNTHPYDTEISAALLSGGGPATAALVVADLIPSVFSGASKYAMAAGVGAAGVVFLQTPVMKVLNVSSGLFGILGTLLSGLDSFVGSFFDGCATETWQTFLGKCVASSSTDKQKMATDWLLMYGATEEQAKLRSQCLNAQMTDPANLWGTDPHTIGTVNSDGTMSNPAACMPAIYWPGQALKAKDPLVLAMWEEISPCLDPTNPSFLPANSDGDKNCQAHFGQFSRFVNGRCVDWTKGVNE